MSELDITFDSSMIRRWKNRITGDKFYFPWLLLKGRNRILRKKYFKTKSGACEYCEKVVARYKKMFA